MMRVTKLDRDNCLELLIRIFEVCGIEAKIFTKQEVVEQRKTLIFLSLKSF